LAGLRGSLFVTFEEGTWAAWLYDLLKPHVTEVMVCNPRKIPEISSPSGRGRKMSLTSPLIDRDFAIVCPSGIFQLRCFH
jgi:hypothetical protein